MVEAIAQLALRSVIAAVVIAAGVIHAFACVAAAADDGAAPQSIEQQVLQTQAAATSSDVAASNATQVQATDAPAASADALSDLARRLAERQPETVGGADDSPSAAAPAAAPAADHPIAPPRRALPIYSDADEDRPIGAAADAAAPGDGSWMLNTLTALALVVGLIFVLRALLRRWGGQMFSTPAAPVVEVLARTAVAPRSHVLVLRLAGRLLIVGESGAGLRTLCEIVDPDEVASVLASVGSGRPQSISHGFSQLLSRFNGDMGQRDELREGGDEAEFSVDRARDRVSSLLARVRNIGNRDPREGEA